MDDNPDMQLFSSLRYDPMLTSIPINTEHWDDSNAMGSPFYMLPFHRDRLLQAAEYFGWSKAVSQIAGKDGFYTLLEKLNNAIPVNSTTPLRVRTLLNRDGKITVETNPTPPVSIFNLYPERIPPPRNEKKVKVGSLTVDALELSNNDTVQGDPDRSVPWDVLPDFEKIEPSPYTSYKTTVRDMYTVARERVGIQSMTEPKEVLILSAKDGEIMEGSLTSVFFWRNGNWTTPPISSGGQIGTTRRWAAEKGFCVEAVVKADELIDGEECWVSNGVRGFVFGKVKLS